MGSGAKSAMNRGYSMGPPRAEFYHLPSRARAQSASDGARNRNRTIERNVGPEIDYDYAHEHEHEQPEIHITIGYFKALRLEHIDPDARGEYGRRTKALRITEQKTASIDT
jgi:hypothetical protein